MLSMMAVSASSLVVGPALARPAVQQVTASMSATMRDPEELANMYQERWSGDSNDRCKTCDKGGNANVGVWTDTPERWDWLRSHLDVQRFRRLIPEAGELPVRRYEFDNLKALNFVIVGYLGQGVASCTKTDPQAKGLGEYLRSVYTEIPDKLVP